MHHHTRAYVAGEQRRSWGALTHLLLLGHQALLAGAILRVVGREGVARRAILDQH